MGKASVLSPSTRFGRTLFVPESGFSPPTRKEGAFWTVRAEKKDHLQRITTEEAGNEEVLPQAETKPRASGSSTNVVSTEALAVASFKQPFRRKKKERAEEIRRLR